MMINQPCEATTGIQSRSSVLGLLITQGGRCRPEDQLPRVAGISDVVPEPRKDLGESQNASASTTARAPQTSVRSILGPLDDHAPGGFSSTPPVPVPLPYCDGLPGVLHTNWSRTGAVRQSHRPRCTGPDPARSQPCDVPVAGKSPDIPSCSPQPALLRLQRVGGRVGRRPIPKGRAAPFRRRAAADTIGRLGEQRRYRSGVPMPLGSRELSPQTCPQESAESPQTSQSRPSTTSGSQARIRRSATCFIGDRKRSSAAARYDNYR